MEFLKMRDRLKSAIKTSGGNKKVSELADISLGTINNYLRGVSEPTVSKLSKIATACNVSLDWIVYGINTNISTPTLQSETLNERAIYLSMETIEEALDASGRKMHHEDKAELLITIYKIYNANKKSIEPIDIKEIIRLVS